jgi:hypothetical protein
MLFEKSICYLDLLSGIFVDISLLMYYLSARNIISKSITIAEPQEEIESLKSFSSATIELEENQDSVRSSKSEFNKHVNAWTLMLLSRLSYSDDPIEKLADPATIVPLATYIRSAKNPKASRILSRIVK